MSLKSSSLILSILLTLLMVLLSIGMGTIFFIGDTPPFYLTALFSFVFFYGWYLIIRLWRAYIKAWADD